MEASGHLAEQVQRLEAAAMLRGDELGVVLASLGDGGDGCSRLAAVVALLTGSNRAAEATRGAFADAPIMVTEPFTSGFHNCLRERAVNAGSSVNHQIRLRKQC